MVSMMVRNKFVWMGILAVILLAACGGSGNGGSASTFTAGNVVCETLTSDSYRYNVRLYYQVDAAPTPTPVGVAPGPNAFALTWEASGEVKDADSYRAEMKVTDRTNVSVTNAVAADGKQWLQTVSGWHLQPESSERPVQLIPYLPVSLCQALAPDIDSTTGQHISEEINGISSERFDYDKLTSDFPDRSADFGSRSDVATLINDFGGSVWLAHDGNFISKMTVQGVGTYEDGTVLHFEISYEISDLGDSIDVGPPV